MFRGYDPDDTNPATQPPGHGWYDPNNLTDLVPVYVPPESAERQLSCGHTIRDSRPAGTKVWCQQCSPKTLEAIM